jgi:nicotinamide-nucleotide amidase
MKSEVISIGTELLLGNIVNTNSAFLSSELAMLGIDVYYHITVGDNPARLEDTFNGALGRSDILITTGGLGPTTDDITKETVAKIAGRKLVADEAELEKLENYFKRMKRPMTPNNLRQVYIPEGSIAVPNDNGTAPGIILELDRGTIIMLPGPPSEMKPMFLERIVPYLRKKSEQTLVSVTLKFFGIGESALEHELSDLIINQSDPTIATYAGEGDVKVRLTSRAKDNQAIPPSITELIKAIEKRLGNYIYSYEDNTIQQVTANALLEGGKTLAIAESCTGGRISSLLTSIPGISKAYKGTVVSYSNDIKENLLGVARQTLDQAGAVSEATALGMASGVRKVCHSDIGLAVTGIAGPEGGTDEKPVGLVFIALSADDCSKCWEIRFGGNREKISTYAAKNALNHLRLYLLGAYSKY